MKVEVKETPGFRADLIRVVGRRVRQTLDALVTAKVYLADMTDQLTTYGGPPDLAEVLRRGPDGLWWLYADGVWVGLTIRTTKRRLWGAAVRTITLTAVEPTPPAGPPPAA